MKIKILMLKNYGKAPKRAHYNDAGADVYCPSDVYIPKHHTAKIPLGFGLEVPDGYMACVYSRSGKSAEGLVCENPPIDSSYRGEIHAIVTNQTDEMVKIKAGDRVGQLVIHPIAVCDFVEDLGEERGTGAFGSTGS